MKRTMGCHFGFGSVTVILVMILLLLVPTGRTSALSTVDDVHTGVGYFAAQWADGTWVGVGGIGVTCSGFLIAPQVFLTAGHCTRGLQTMIDQGLLQAIYVTFDSQYTLNSPLVNIARMVSMPYTDLSPNDPADLGVVLLASPVTDRPLTALPPPGLLDTLKLAPGTPVTDVGYGFDTNGANGGPNSVHIKLYNRTSGVLGFKNIEEGNYIHVSMLDNQGYDYFCFGDSGGPGFVQVNGQEQLIGVNTNVNSASCAEQGLLYRLDTPQAQAFLSQIVPLP